jgi:hypothetical protein
MGYIYDDWKKLLEDFQKCVEKDLEEIHQQKAEVQQIKSDIFNKVGRGPFLSRRHPYRHLRSGDCDW